MDLLKEYDEKMKPLRRIVGVAMEVYNEWGAGLLESAYEAGMKHLLDKDPTINVERQKPLPMYWKDELLEDHYRIDLVINNVIVELKACKFVSNEHKRQLHNYMRLTKTTYGLLINFSDKQVFSEAFKLYPNGDIEKVDREVEYNKAFDKALKALKGGLTISDMGTRRRFDFQNHHDVLKAFCDAVKYRQKDCSQIYTGKFVGTSNVWFAKEFNLVPIGTMSHQICSFEECVSGVFECNHNVMQKWSDVYDGDLGIFLPDCFGSKVFMSNFSKKMAKMFDGIRIDSGDEREETEKMIEKYQSLGIDPSTKSIVYSNALTIDKAIDIHKWLDGRMKDSYGIGTHLMADVTNKLTGEKFPYSNIVIKLTGMRITELREWRDCVKLSNDKGKTLGNAEKCNYLVKQIG